MAYDQAVDQLAMRDRAVARILRKRGVDSRFRSAAVRLLPDDTAAVLLYGSRARGDHTDESDVDLLVIVDSPRGSRSSGGVNLSCYTREQFASARGTLFGMHLRRDGAVVWDPTSCLQARLDALADPDPTALFAKIRHLGAILDVPPVDRDRYCDGLSRIARYLLRTAIYVRALAEGHPCFSVRELAARYRTPELALILSSNPHNFEHIDAALVLDLVRRLVDVVGELPPNPFGSLRAIVVGEWFSDPDRAAIATLALAKGSERFDYARLPKVLL